MADAYAQNALYEHNVSFLKDSEWPPYIHTSISFKACDTRVSYTQKQMSEYAETFFFFLVFTDLNKDKILLGYLLKPM